MFVMDAISLFCNLGPQAKFQNHSLPPSGIFLVSLRVFNTLEKRNVLHKEDTKDS